MKWIYNNYEFENRINNLSWTISGKYDEDIHASEKDYTSKEVALYFAIMAGARHKYINWDIVKKYLVSRVKKGYDLSIISNLIQISLNRVVESRIIEERPGIEDVREKAYKDVVSGFTKIYNEDVLQKVKYALVLEGMGKHPTLDGLSRRIINNIKEIDINQSIIEMLKSIDLIYLNYFQQILNGKEDTAEKSQEYADNTEIDFDTFANFMYEELYNDEENQSIENEINEIASSILVESIGESEIEQSHQSSDRIIYVDEETLDKIYKKMEHYYGKSYLTKSEIKKIETRNCRNVHEGCRIHFTEGVLRSECSNIVQIKYVTRQKENNISKFRDKIKIHKRNIVKLKDSISRILIEESERSRIYSDCGTVYANRAWRASKSNNKKIFYKDVENEKGKYVIDILLDSSGSQSRNQANVATQAYIIARALTMVGIPNRVIGFSSFMDYTILKRFKNYEDNVDSSENIFEYFCAGNNRDGLAIKSTCEGLLKRNEENKILIVLSDGRPNDVKIGKDRERSIRGEMAYRGVVGVRDAANEVRKARQNGILVLGVFTGKETDLEAERLIYGKDFIYTKDIERFSDIVSMYLKKIIRN
ncbi:cobaltochelatase CobT-related protein [Romboutsia sp.]|uniref:cobaltochelatase CobT-related protein n=1 Tax=Romboutsia sp. TaxID=1965302 RepID=UPI002CBCC43F|nr:nitric oxide reductase activation-like protein [Romboutsia sp.]HSQ89986.1 nitric oxide reductase activation-like protein [Romboutsia sp.]